MSHTLPTHQLITPVTQGDFTAGNFYPLLRTTVNGNGGARGFYLDNNLMCRMVPSVAFDTTAPGEPYQLPVPAERIPNKRRGELATRWNIHKQTVHDWQRPESKNPQLLRLDDALRGSEFLYCDEQLTRHELKILLDRHGFYIQELAARWGMQEFGQKIYRDVITRPALFWDMWRGMVSRMDGVE